MMRIGHGYDAHRFADPVAGRKLILGGIHIPYKQGLLAHSDGDAVIHALCDALLGALAKGDIGRHFPDTDPALAGVDSAVLLQKVVAMMQGEGWQLLNADITILAQAPKMSPHISAMQTRLARLLCSQEDQVNIKASTTEGMGFVGRGEGIETYAVVLLSAARQT